MSGRRSTGAVAGALNLAGQLILKKQDQEQARRQRAEELAMQFQNQRDMARLQFQSSVALDAAKAGQGYTDPYTGQAVESTYIPPTPPEGLVPQEYTQKDARGNVTTYGPEASLFDVEQAKSLGLEPSGVSVGPNGKITRTYSQPKLEKYQPTTREEALQYEKDLAAAKGQNIATPEGLTSDQQIQARSLARKISGVRGAEKVLPSIYAEMKQGKSIDEIEDNLRYAGQSPEFVGPVRDAAQTIMINAPKEKTQNAMDYMDDLISRGDQEGVKEQIKRLAREQSGVDEKRIISGAERTISLLDEIQDDLITLQEKGFDTGFFRGNIEKIAGKVGRITDPEARKVATKIAAAIQKYRRAMSGVAFSVPESEEYKAIFPSIDKIQDFNLQNIQALREVLNGDLETFYILSMGQGPYESLFSETKQQEKSVNPDLRQAAIEELRRRGRIQ